MVGVLRTVRAGMLAVPSRGKRLPHLPRMTRVVIDLEMRAVLTEIGNS